MPYSLSLSLSLLLCSLPKPLKKAMKLCTKEDSTPDSLSTSLLSALHYGLDSLAEKEKQDGGMCLTQDHLHSLLQTFKVLRCVPLDSLSGGLLLRILVAVATWHVATVTCVMVRNELYIVVAVDSYLNVANSH